MHWDHLFYLLADRLFSLRYFWGVSCETDFLPNSGSSLQTRGAGTCREFKTRGIQSMHQLSLKYYESSNNWLFTLETRGIQSMHQMSLKYYELSNNWLFTLVQKFTCLFYPPKRSSSEGWRWWQLPSMEKTHRTLRRGLICFFYCTVQAKLVFKIYFYYF